MQRCALRLLALFLFFLLLTGLTESGTHSTAWAQSLSPTSTANTVATSQPAAQAPLGHEGFLMVAFGSSAPEARPAFEGVEAAFRSAFPGKPLVWAWTSQIIRKKLASQGRPVDGISQGLARLAAQGVRRVRVQSLHIMAGEEFSALERAVLLDIQKHPGRFDAVFLGRPLLESRQDAEETARALLAAGPNQSHEQGPEGHDRALALMGHGQAQGRADLVFEGARSLFRSLFQAESAKVFMATVEGSRDADSLLNELQASQVRQVRLQPLMLVAGEHARNDLSGPEADSWASRLTSAGYTVTSDLRGLGEIPAVCAVFVRHARESTDDLTREPGKP